MAVGHLRVTAQNQEEVRPKLQKLRKLRKLRNLLGRGTSRLGAARRRIGLFDDVTGATALDCLTDETGVCFLVAAGEMAARGFGFKLIESTLNVRAICPDCQG